MPSTVVPPMPSKVIIEYQNTRYQVLPSRISIRANKKKLHIPVTWWQISSLATKSFMFLKFRTRYKIHTPIPTSNIRPNSIIAKVPDLRAHQLLYFLVEKQVQPSYPPCFVIQTAVSCLLPTGGEHAARIRERRGQTQWRREHMGLRLAVNDVPFKSST